MNSKPTKKASRQGLLRAHIRQVLRILIRSVTFLTLGTFLWMGCSLGGGSDSGGGGSGESISTQPITSISGTVSTFFDQRNSQVFSYDFLLGKTIWFGFNNMPGVAPNSGSSSSFTFSLSTYNNLDASILESGNDTFGAGLTYGDSAAKFTEAYLSISVPLSNAELPEGGFVPTELIVQRATSSASQWQYLRYIYASAATTVIGTTSLGDTYNLSLNSGWNQVLASFNLSTQKWNHQSLPEPSGMGWVGTLQTEQVYVGGTVTHSFEANGINPIDPNFFTEPQPNGKRIVLDYGRGGTMYTSLYAPANQASFAFAAPIPYDEQLRTAEQEFGSGVSATGPGASTARFSQLHLSVFNNTVSVGSVYQGKQGVGQNQDKYYFLTYIYASNSPVTLSGTVSASNPTEIYNNVSLSTGWNVVLGEYDTTTTPNWTITYSNPQASDLTGLVWFVW